MLSYLSLILVPILAGIFFTYGKIIHKHEYKIYTVFLAISGLLVILLAFNVNIYTLTGVYEVYYTGHLSFALFTLVMAGGAFKKRTFIKIKIMRVRREMAILGFITVIPHAALRLDLALSGFNFTGLMAMFIIVPLVITSLPVIRKKMHPSTWKKVHYTAYGVYFLLYLHLIFDVFITRDFYNVSVKNTGWVYLTLFIIYVVLKVRVILSEKKLKKV